MRRLLTGAVLAATVGLAAGAQAAKPREGSIPWFMALDDDTLVVALVECRSDLRKAETQVCGNAEVAANRLYARRLARSRMAFLQSPLYWLENPEMAGSVRDACSRRGTREEAVYRWAFRYCDAVSRVPQGRRI